MQREEKMKLNCVKTTIWYIYAWEIRRWIQLWGHIIVKFDNFYLTFFVHAKAIEQSD